jgi:hypothetical protein
MAGKMIAAADLGERDPLRLKHAGLAALWGDNVMPFSLAFAARLHDLQPEPSGSTLMGITAGIIASASLEPPARPLQERDQARVVAAVKAIRHNPGAQ